MSDNRYTPKKRMSRRRFWGLVVFFVFILLAAFVVMTPVVMKCSKKAAITTSLSNSKQIYLLLIEFDHDFGEFPSDKTALQDPDLKDYTGKYSNDYLGQFLAGGYVRSEEIFYAKGGSDTKNLPDNDFSTREKTLEAGECGFAYVKGLNATDFHTYSPILMAPMYGDGYRFNPDVYEGKALVLQVDGRAKTLLIDKNHHVNIGKGKTLFEGGQGTVWGEKGFDSKNLCYAKYPCHYQKPMAQRLTGRVVVWVIVVSIVGFFLIYKGVTRRKRS